MARLTIMERLLRNINKLPNGCWLWTGYTWRDGYGFIRVRNKFRRVYRVMWEEFYGVELSSEVVVRHKCHNKLCINPNHLELGSQIDNVADECIRGMHGKLNSEAVKVIRYLRSKGTSNRQLARAYKVSCSTISQITNNMAWRHVDGV